MIELPIEEIPAIWSILGSLITAGGALLGGILGDKAADKRLQEAQARDDRKIQTLVKDARIAGIHPLAALGSSISLSSTIPQGQSQTGSAIGDASRAIGQGVSRSSRA